MADEPIQMDEPSGGPREAPLAEEPRSAEERPRRSLWGLLGIAALAVIVVLILLLLKDCSGSGAAPESGNGRKSIERVGGLVPVEGSVSVWISRDTTLKDALVGAGVRALNSLSLGEGRYIVEVRAGTENRAARALAEQPGVFDAGRVYEAEQAE